MRHYFLITSFIFSGIISLIGQEENNRGNLIVLDTNEIGSDTTSQAAAKYPFITKVKKVIDKERGYILSPEFGLRPETGILTGLYYLQLFSLKMKPDTASKTRTSNVESYFDYTQKQQIIALVRNNLLFDKEKFILRGENIFNKYPSYFWGVGNESPAQVKDTISYDWISITQKLVRKINNRYFAGVQYQYTTVFDIQHKPGDVFDSEDIPGKNGSKTSGLGLVFLYDSRDNIINTYKGFYVDASLLIDQKVFGSQYAYNNLIIDARKFISLSKTKIRVLAFQGLLNYNSGDVPWRQMAAMGGDQIMRGYYTGRFLDKIMVAGQFEFRFQVWNRIGFTTFVSVAEVGPTFSSFVFDDIHYTYGVCFRYMINKKEHLNIGADFGFGHQTSGQYFNSGEAF